jgi:hypothetical protein
MTMRPHAGITHKWQKSLQHSAMLSQSFHISAVYYHEDSLGPLTQFICLSIDICNQELAIISFLMSLRRTVGSIGLQHDPVPLSALLSLQLHFTFPFCCISVASEPVLKSISGMRKGEGRHTVLPFPGFLVECKAASPHC